MDRALLAPESLRVWLDQTSAAQDCGKCQERGSVAVQLGPGPSPLGGPDVMRKCLSTGEGGGRM